MNFIYIICSEQGDEIELCMSTLEVVWRIYRRVLLTLGLLYFIYLIIVNLLKWEFSNQNLKIIDIFSLLDILFNLYILVNLLKIFLITMW